MASVYSTLESLHEAEYCFVTFSTDASGNILLKYGTAPEQVLTTWSDVQAWYESAHAAGHQHEQAVGYIGYEQGCRFVKPSAASNLLQANPTTLPPVLFGVFNELNSVAITDTTLPADTANRIKSSIQLSPDASRAQYEQQFKQIQQHIQQGDIYQANLTYRLTGVCTVDSWQLFSYLYSQQPTNKAVYIRTPEFSVVSVSPEEFLQITPDTIRSAPMKGTRPRGNTPKADVALQQELISSEKDQAELDMIIDIHRNDLARVSNTGTVTVTERRRTTALPTVWQADAVITAQRNNALTVLDCIELNFPAGSITGAPKIRAMELLNTLEPTSREVYTGAIGTIRANNTANLSVAIRTAVQLHDNANSLHYYVGGGIVFDSVLADEYQETLDKAQIIAPQ